MQVDGHTYVTTPGSVLLFPSLCAPTGESLPVKPKPGWANRATERNHNRQARQARRTPCETYASEAHDPAGDPDPPPF